MANDRADRALLTDLYQLAMLQGYFENRMTETAVFEFFVRKMPEGRNFLLAAGLAQALDYLEAIRFKEAELDWLSRSGRFSRAFVDRLASFRFTGDVHAMPEGTVFFPDEPILRVTAPLPEAQLVETRLINILHFQTLIASKAARFVLAAPGKHLIDFGLRRAHGAEAGLWAARAAFLAGFDGSATVEAESRFGVPSYGTMAHSFVQAHDTEEEAFLHFAAAQPKNVVFLLDTYDTESAARKAVAIAPKLRAAGIEIQGVRLDSGDLLDHSRKVRRILDDGHLSAVRIFASGNLDEYRIRDLLAGGAPIDGFGIGSNLVTSTDAPVLDCAYKLQEYAGRARRKRSEGKATWPGRKQVYRRNSPDGRMGEDVVALEDESVEGTPLLSVVMRQGRRSGPAVPLAESRRRAVAHVSLLPNRLRSLESDTGYSVQVSSRLRSLASDLDAASG